MILRLEIRACESRLNILDVDVCASQCDQFPYCIVKNYYTYTCPACGKCFDFLSGLLQHAESDSCTEIYGEETVPWQYFFVISRRIYWMIADEKWEIMTL
jgi:hypothetical protein